MKVQIKTMLQFFRYVLAGGITAMVELLSFLGLLKLGWWYIWANLIAFCLAVIVGFFLQKYFTFHNREKLKVQQMVKFLVIVGVGYLLTNFYLWFFIDFLAWSPVISKCLQLILVMVSNYAGQKWFTFR